MLKGAKFYETVVQHCVTFTFCVLKVVQMLIVQKKKMFVISFSKDKQAAAG